jgi:hypothetical protein
LSAAGERLRRHREHLALGVIVVATVVVAYAARTSGHWWGDDWALYLRQADSLFSGTVRDVIDDNRFTVDVSPGTEFSPPLYPWGFPLILSPFVAVIGLDLDRLMIVEVLSFAVFLVMWHRLARPRVGPVVALVGTAVLAMSPQYLRWTELIQSELPFMAVVLVALVVLDRERSRAAMITVGESLWPLVLVGVSAAAAFTVRREGLAMVPTVAAAQLVALGVWWYRRDDRSLRTIPWRPLVGRLALPHLVWLATIGLLQVVLPSTLVPSYRGTGVRNVVRFASDHLGHVAESLGLKDVPTETPTVLGSAALGWLAVAAFVVLLVGGIAWSAWRRPVPDIPLAVFLVVVFVIGGSFRYPGTRYVAVVGPIALIFATGAARRLLERFASPRSAQFGVAGVLALLLVANVVRAADLVGSARDFERAGQVEWGPDARSSVEMFAAVERLTDPEDVVGFFKARAMTLLTDRRALQIGGSRSVDAVADELDFVVLESADPQSGEIESDPAGFAPIWTNGRFTLYRVLPQPN